MKKTKCHKIVRCPIFSQGIMMTEKTGETFKKHYCLNADKYQTCKRFQTSEKSNSPIPITILPNSLLSIEEILRRIEQN